MIVMFSRFVKFLRSVWRSLAFIGTVVGILYLWPNIRDLPSTFGGTWELPNWLDGEHLAYGLLAFACAWIFWIDARPFVKEWWRKRSHSSTFNVSENIYCASHFINSSSDEQNLDIFENIFYLVVGNNLKTGQKLTRVQARIFHIGEPTLCRIKDSEAGEIDIRHGEWAFFEIGRLVSKEKMGSVHGFASIEEGEMKSYTHNIPQGALSFKIGSAVNKREYGLSVTPEHPHVWEIFMAISADDVKSARANIDIDMSKTRSPVSCELIA